MTIFSFFVPAPIIRLTGDGWLHKQRQVHQFYKEQAALKKIDAFQVPIPQIDGVIGVHDVKDHPELEFAFIDYEVSFFENFSSSPVICTMFSILTLQRLSTFVTLKPRITSRWHWNSSTTVAVNWEHF